LPPVTLEELEQLATAHNPTLVQLAMRIRAAQGEQLQAGLYPNPIVGYLGEEMGQDGQAGKQGAFVAQEFVTGGKFQLNRSISAHEIHQAQYAWQAQRQAVLNDVRTAYVAALGIERALSLNEQLVRISREGLKAAEQLREAKEVGYTDVLQARIEMEAAELQWEITRNRRLAAWRRLVAVVGVPDLPLSPLAGALEGGIPEFNWDTARARLLAESPLLGEARAAVERSRCALARQHAERLPNVTVESFIGRDNATDDTLASVQVGLPLPVFNRNQGNIAKAHAQLTAAQQEVRRIELLLHDRLAAVFERYANARQRVEKYNKEILPKAGEALELTRKGYQHGEFSYLAVLTAQRTYFRVNLAYLESLVELCTSAVAIEGFLLSGGLQAQAEPVGVPEPSTTEGSLTAISP
jgi:cobalt-zinc-cadmium efflux system outer membrane protein